MYYGVHKKSCHHHTIPGNYVMIAGAKAYYDGPNRSSFHLWIGRRNRSSFHCSLFVFTFYSPFLLHLATFLTFNVYHSHRSLDLMRMTDSLSTSNVSSIVWVTWILRDPHWSGALHGIAALLLLSFVLMSVLSLIRCYCYRSEKCTSIDVTYGKKQQRFLSLCEDIATFAFFSLGGDLNRERYNRVPFTDLVMANYCPDYHRQPNVSHETYTPPVLTTFQKNVSS